MMFCHHKTPVSHFHFVLALGVNVSETGESQNLPPAGAVIVLQSAVSTQHHSKAGDRVSHPDKTMQFILMPWIGVKSDH